MYGELGFIVVEETLLTKILRDLTVAVMKKTSSLAVSVKVGRKKNESTYILMTFFCALRPNSLRYKLASSSLQGLMN